MTFKKANLATWGEEDANFGEEEENDEEALLYIIALDNEIDEVFNSNLSCFSDHDDINDLYHELYDSLVRAKKELKLKTIENESFLEKIKLLEKENHDLTLLVEQLLFQNKSCAECKF